MFSLENAIIYQVYLRTFTAEGTLKAAEALIPHLKDLGINVIYLSACNKEDDSPEWQSPRQVASGMDNVKNPYRISDYFDIDEEYGSLQDLKDFINTAHEYNIKVLCDLVFLHCGNNAVFLEENPDFVIRDENGNIINGERWPFARFDYKNPELREYLYKVMEFYIKECNADGYRCDVADMCPLDFWEEGILRIKKINPDVIMINEGQNVDFLKVFDFNYTYKFTHKLNNCFLNPDNSLVPIEYTEEKAKYLQKIPTEEFRDIIKEVYDEIPKGRYTLLNSENHDTVSDFGTDRIEMYLGSDAAEAVMAILFTLKGAPMIYNGCEVADSVEKNMFWNRFSKGTMSVQWQNALTKKGKNRLNFLKELISMRNEFKALTHGDVELISHDCEDSVIAYKRDNEMFVFVNVTKKTIELKSNEELPKNAVFKKSAEQISDKIKLEPYGIMILKK